MLLSGPSALRATLQAEWAQLPGEVLPEEESSSLRVISLNILAEGLARGRSTPLEEPPEPCPAWFEQDGAGGVAYREGASGGESDFRFRCSIENLAWERRWPMLRALILEHNPDLIGLQEVDLMESREEQLRTHDKEIRRDLFKAGYDGTFSKKGGRACDGVGLFWRRSRLKQAGRTETWRLGRGVHVALAQPLCLDGSLRFTAVATHLKAGLTEEAESAREEQAMSIIHHLRFHQSAVVLADLNSHCRPITLGGSPDAANQAALTGQLLEPRSYPLLTAHMQSACQAVLGDEPSFTVWGGWEDREVRLICDYVLVKGELLRPWRVLRVPPAAEVLRFAERLPNAEHPSDHVPIVADLAVVRSEALASGQPAPAVKRQRLP